MYVVTFYSFKGGVGRTMALVNAAVELTLRGKKVLVVDFDLEAPGIQTYEPFARSLPNLGMVDYVTDYIREGSAPDFRKYVVENKINDKPIWLMPAGLPELSYADKLNSIDWLALYREKSGYLMFEDLKQQWKLSFDFDYVLVDSRTGHTDVGGICTRQLPDLNVLMFFPNEQNISGLVGVANSIRAEARHPNDRKIHIHFCPSNVPDLDDEDMILQRHLDRSKESLDYKEPASVIYHYNSLALLDQKIFVRDRKKTRLADQYRRLVNAIVSENLEDRSGALSRLEKIRSSIWLKKAEASSIATEESLDAIFRMHGADGEVAWSLAAAYYVLGNVKGEIESLNMAIKQGYNEMTARSRRASLLGAKQIDQVRIDLKIIISSFESTVPELISAISRLREVDSAWLNAIVESERIKQLDQSDLGRVIKALMVDSEGASVASDLLLNKQAATQDISTDLLLALIGSGNYQKAREALGCDRSVVLKSGSIEKVFNLACAEWGQSGEPPLDLFHRTLEIGSKTERATTDPNFMQCLSLSSYLLGFSSDALAQLELAKEAIQIAAPSEFFSCWRYLYLNKNEFISDLEKMEDQMIDGEKLVPDFLQRRSLLQENIARRH